MGLRKADQTRAENSDLALAPGDPTRFLRQSLTLRGSLARDDWRGDSRGMGLAIFAAAAIAEIAGCFAFWMWLRHGASPRWIAPGMAALALFAWLLTLAPTDAAGRAYAAYGGVYVAASLIWLWLVESRPPDRWDVAGAVICVAGAAVILFGPRS